MHVVPALVVSLKDVCFRYCCCKWCAVSVAITAATSGPRFRLSNAFQPTASSQKVKLRAVRSPVTALHSDMRRGYTG